MTDEAGDRSGSDCPGGFSGSAPRTSAAAAVPTSSLVVLIRNEWNEEHVAVGPFDRNDDAVDAVSEWSVQPGNRGYTYGIMPLIPPGEYSNGEWNTNDERGDVERTQPGHREDHADPPRADRLHLPTVRRRPGC